MRVFFLLALLLMSGCGRTPPATTEDGNVNARIDCNRARGTWKSSGKGQLEFGPMAVTRAACLSLMADGGTYEFEGMP